MGEMTPYGKRRVNNEAYQERVRELELRAAECLVNAFQSRTEFIRRMTDKNGRNVDEEVGYPDPAELTCEYFQAMYDTQAVAARVVDLLPNECFQVQPSVYEDEDSETPTLFEQAWDDLGRTIRGPSMYQDEKGGAVWEILHRADRLSGIGRFGIILLGVDDKKPLDQPVDGIDPITGEPRDTFETVRPDKSVTTTDGAALPKGKAKGTVVANRETPVRRLIFARPYEEQYVKILTYESDQFSPRFGLPTSYEVTLQNPNFGGTTGVSSEGGIPGITKQVHWTRVIHIADNCGSSEVVGVSRMRPVYKNLINVDRLYGGSTEMYWRGAFPGSTIETLPGINPADFNLTEMRQNLRDELYNSQAGLERTKILMGMTEKDRMVQVSDPTPQINVQLGAIALRVGCPVRVLMGSERGELASSQDDSSWNDRLKNRQETYLTPRLIVPFVDRLIAIGVLPKPKGYSVEWPSLDSVSDAQKATTALARIQAMQAYVSGNVVSLMGETDLLVRELGYDEEAAESILENATVSQEAKIEKTMELDKQGLMPDGTPKPPPPVIAGGKLPPGKAAGKPPAKKPTANEDDDADDEEDDDEEEPEGLTENMAVGQPRVPAGVPTGGEWTTGKGGGVGGGPAPTAPEAAPAPAATGPKPTGLYKNMTPYALAKDRVQRVEKKLIQSSGMGTVREETRHEYTYTPKNGEKTVVGYVVTQRVPQHISEGGGYVKEFIGLDSDGKRVGGARTAKDAIEYVLRERYEKMSKAFQDKLEAEKKPTANEGEPEVEDPFGLTDNMAAGQPRVPAGSSKGGEWTSGKLGGVSGTGIIQDKHGAEYQITYQPRTDAKGTVKHEYAISTVGHDVDTFGPDVGKIEMKRNGEEVSHFNVYPEHQRKGIATAAHDHVEAHLGIKIKETWATTPDGEAFYKARKAKEKKPTANEGGPEVEDPFDLDVNMAPNQPRVPAGSSHGGEWSGKSGGGGGAGAITQAEWESSLSNDEKDVIKGWSEYMYAHIRNCMNKGEGCDRVRDGRPISEHVSILNAALDRAPKYEGEVYRAMRFSEVGQAEFIASAEKGGLIDRGIASTTKSQSLGLELIGNRGLIMHIKSKTAVDISGISKKGEQEVLMRGGASLRHLKTEVTGSVVNLYMEES